LPADQIQASKVVPLAQRVRTIRIIDREKLGRDDNVAVLTSPTRV
jgi:hypothetical protein